MWKIFYRDANGRDAESRPLPTKEAAIEQARDLELRQKCQVVKIEGPNGETVDRLTLTTRQG
jgi:hypothetical protein